MLEISFQQVRKSKKGQLGIGSAISGVFQSIGHFISTVPPVLKWFLFLVFLSIFLVIMTFFFGIFGYHCDTSGNVYKNSMFNIFENFDLMFNRPDPERISATDLEISDVQPLSACLTPNSTIENGTPILHGVVYNGVFCTDCEEAPLNEQFNDKVCVGDVFRLDESNKSFVQQMLCGESFIQNQCEPPIGYFYNSTTESYMCDRLSICGNVTIGSIWDQKLEEKADKIEVPLETSRSYTDAFSVQCSDTLRPGFRFFGIPLFDFRLWILLSVLIALLVVFIRIRTME